MQSLIDNDICFPIVVHLSTHQNPNCGTTPSSPNLTCLPKAKIASWICWMLPTRPLDGHMCCYQKLSDWLAITGRCLLGRLGVHDSWKPKCFMLLNMIPFSGDRSRHCSDPSFQDDTFYIACKYFIDDIQTNPRHIRRHWDYPHVLSWLNRSDRWFW